MDYPTMLNNAALAAADAYKYGKYMDNVCALLAIVGTFAIIGATVVIATRIASRW